jgi:hypothetical protein
MCEYKAFEETRYQTLCTVQGGEIISRDDTTDHNSKVAADHDGKWSALTARLIISPPLHCAQGLVPRFFKSFVFAHQFKFLQKQAITNFLNYSSNICLENKHLSALFKLMLP